MIKYYDRKLNVKTFAKKVVFDFANDACSEWNHHGGVTDTIEEMTEDERYAVEKEITKQLKRIKALLK